MEDLSPETLAALREFASMQGICSEEEEDVLSSVRHHFDVHDKNEAFTFSFSREGAQAIEFTVHGWKRELGQTLSSTGLTIWRAAEQLIDFLYHNSELVSGKRVCELGAGLGVVSILLDKLQCCDEIVCTDGDDDTLELLRRNAEHCDCTFDVRKLWWGEHDMILEEYPRRFDILIAADVIYEEEQVAPLLKSANAIMTGT